MDDVNAMADIMGAFDDAASGRMTAQLENALAQNNPNMMPEGTQDIAAMKGILSDLYDVAGDDLSVNPTQHQAQQAMQRPQPIAEAPEDMSYEEYLAYTNGKGLQDADPNTGQQVQPQQNNYIQAKNEWIVESVPFDGVKSINKHTIKSNVTGNVLFSDIALKESAFALRDMLNKGIPVNDPRMLGIISTGMRYTAIVESMVGTLRKKKQVVRESNYEEAMKCDQKLNESKKEASNIKQTLIDHLKKHNII